MQTIFVWFTSWLPSNRNILIYLNTLRPDKMADILQMLLSLHLFDWKKYTLIRISLKFNWKGTNGNKYAQHCFKWRLDVVMHTSHYLNQCWRRSLTPYKATRLHGTRDHNDINMKLIWTWYPWWRHQMETFARYWPFVLGIHRSPVNSTHKGQWGGALMFSSSKQSWGWWYETPSPSLWRHCNVRALDELIEAF